MSDFKMFLMYILDPKGLINGFKDGFSKVAEPKIMSVLFIYLALLSLFLSKEPNYPTIMGLLILSFIIQLRIAYIGGDHRYWHKKKIIDEVEKNRSNKD